MSVEELHKNRMMAHLMDALDRQEDIGHYGRLVFAMVGQYFLDDKELVGYLRKNAGFDQAAAEGLCAQVRSRHYTPPSRRQILEWQREQSFPICPNPEDPDAGNVYDDLKFPHEVYEKIDEYYEHKARS